ncbi:MAG: Uma2 family endonuclease [Phormidesmis sp.]
MTVTTQKLTFEEYLKYEDGTDSRYELVNGELVSMSLGKGRHGRIIRFLARKLDAEIAKQRQPWIAEHSLIGVQSPRGSRWDTSRIPDITVLPVAQFEAMDDRETVIRLNEPPPLLVVEVVSPSTQSDDYRAKRTEYAGLEIPEYWIVDPIEGCIIVGAMENRFYDSSDFRGDEIVRSHTFPNLKLTVAQILSAKL